MSTPPFLHEVLGTRERELVHPRTPAFVPPMLPVVRNNALVDSRWLVERRLDGVRMVVVRDEHGAHLWSAGRTNVTACYPDLAHALDAQVPPGVVVDGEVVTPGAEALLYLFDVTVVAGHDVTALTLRTRKRLLDQVTELSGPVRLCPHRPGHDGDLACRAGLVLKRANAPYRAGRRSADWLVLPGDR